MNRQFFFLQAGLWLFSLLAVAQVEHVGDRTLVMTVSGYTVKIPYYANHAVDSDNRDILHAVIVVHGALRNADVYFSNMMDAAAMRPEESDSTLIVAPQFLSVDDIAEHHLDDEYLYWSDGGWKSGSRSKDYDMYPRPVRISSYAVLDTLLLRIAEHCPSLTSIVFTGHSAGGQYTHRYAATSPMTDHLCEDHGIPVCFIVANPSSYLYFNNKRRVQGTTDRFAVPQTTCTDYNEWKYGLKDLYAYPAAAGADSIRNMYRRREVVYLLGEKDNDPGSPSLDVSCAAMLQGQHRLERGTVYYNYLKDYYGEGITGKQVLDTVPGVGHDNYGMYTSLAGLYYLFELPVTACSEPAGIVDLRRQELPVYPNPAVREIHIRTDMAGSLILYDLQGRRVRKAGPFAPGELTLNIASLTDGVYLLEFRSGSGVQSVRIIKAADHRY